MAITLDQLIVEITAKDEKIAAALRSTEQRLDRFERGVNTKLGGIDKSFSRLSNSIGIISKGLGLIGGAAALRGLTSLTKGALESADAIAKTADRLTVSTDFLQEWQFAAARTGVEAKTMETAFQRLERRLGQFTATGGGPAKEAFEALGISVEDARTQYDSLEKILPVIADRLQSVGTEAEQLAIVQKLVDSEGVKLVNTLRLGSKGIADFGRQAHTTGNVMEHDLLRQAERVNDAFDTAADAIDKQFKSALIELSPVIGAVQLKLAQAAVSLVQLAKDAGLLKRSLQDDLTIQLNELREHAANAEAQLNRMKLRLEELQRAGKPIGPGLIQSIAAQEQVVNNAIANLEAFEKQIEKTGETSKTTTADVNNLSAGYRGLESADEAAKAQEKLAKGIERLNKSIEGQISNLKADIIALNQTEREAVKFEAQQLRLQGASEDLVEEFERLSLQKLGLEEKAEKAKEAQESFEKYLKSLRDGRSALDDLLDAHDKEIAALNAEAAVFQKLNTGAVSTQKGLRELAVIQEELRLRAQGAEDGLRGETDTVRAMAEELVDARARVDELRTSFEDSILTVGDFGRALTDSLVNFDTSGFERLAQDVSSRFFDQLLFGKQGFDQTLIGNFSGLFGQGGILGSIFNRFTGTATSVLGNTGTQSGQAFTGSFSTVVGGLFSGQGFSPLVNSPGGGTSGQSGLPGIFGQQGITSGQAFGVGFLSTVGNIFGAQSTGGQIGAGVGGIVGAIAGAPFGPAGAAIGAQFGSSFLGAIGDLFDDLLGGPGRIEKQKKGIESFVEQTLGIRVHATFERYRQDAERTFAAVEDALESLGATYALQTGAGIGAVKRFANITQAGFQRNAFSVRQAEEAVADLARSLGLDLNEAISNINSVLQGGFERNRLTLSEYREELRENQNEFVLLEELISGAIQVFTQFNPLVDASKIANEELARAFEEAAAGAGATGSEVESLAQQIAEGTIRVEDALIKLNELAGLNLDLNSIILDPDKIEDAVQAVLKRIEGIESAVAQAISTGLSNGATSAKVGQAFESLFEQIIQQRIIDKVFTDTLTTLFDGIDLTKPFEAGSTEAATLRDRVEEAYQRTVDLLRAAGVLPDAFNDATGSAGNLANNIADATSEAERLVSEIRKLDAELAEIARKKIEVEIRFVQNLESLGAISTLSSLGIQQQAAQSQLGGLINADPRLNTPQNIGNLNLDEIEEALGLIQQIETLTVQKFQAEKAQIEENLAQQIANADRQAAIFSNAVNQKFDGLIQEAQQQATAAIAQLRASAEADKERIRASFDAQRDAISARIDGLNKEKDLIKAVSDQVIDGLEKQLQVAEDFKRVAESLENQIRQLSLSAGSALSLPQQFSFLQRQAGALRQQIGAAPLSAQPDLIRELSDVLGQTLGLGLFQSQDPRQADLFNSILAELEDLQAETEAQGAKTVPIEEQILAAEQSMEASLTSIDAQIDQQRDLLSSLSDKERAALDAVGKNLEAAILQVESSRDAKIAEYERQRTEQLNAIEKARKQQVDEVTRLANAEIDKLRNQAVAELEALRQQEQFLLDRQQAILEAQQENLRRQLIELVGIDEATKLLAAGDNALLLLMARLGNTLDSLDATLATIIPAQHGYQGRVIKPQLFLAGEHGPEDVSITPAGISQGGMGSLSFSPTFNLAIPEGSTQDPVSFGRQFAASVVEVVLQDIRPGGRINRELRRRL